MPKLSFPCRRESTLGEDGYRPEFIKFPFLSDGAAILVACLITGAISWASTHRLVTAVAWITSGFTQTQANTHEARQHRAQLARLVKELDQAYYQLERSNAALVAARHVAEEAERFKTEFVTNVSHELRTPLNLIVGYSELMMTSPESYAGAPLPGPYRVDLDNGPVVGDFASAVETKDIKVGDDKKSFIYRQRKLQF